MYYHSIFIYKFNYTFAVKLFKFQIEYCHSKISAIIFKCIISDLYNQYFSHFSQSGNTNYDK